MDKAIYSEAVKTIVGYHKRSLLDFVDALEPMLSLADPKTKDTISKILGRIKGRIHNDLSQCSLSLGVLLSTILAGGNIEPFEDNMINKKSDDHKNTRI
jgi:hypothetical protein